MIPKLALIHALSWPGQRQSKPEKPGQGHHAGATMLRIRDHKPRGVLWNPVSMYIRQDLPPLFPSSLLPSINTVRPT